MTDGSISSDPEGVAGEGRRLWSASFLGLTFTQLLTAANGVFGLTTVAATVIGMVLGSWLSEATGYRGQERWWLSAAVLLGVAAAGVLASLAIGRCGRESSAPVSLGLVAADVSRPTCAGREPSFVAGCFGGHVFLVGRLRGSAMQHRSPRTSRGAILAAANFVTFAGVLLSGFLYYGLRAPVYAGSLDNVAREHRGGLLPEASQQRVEGLAARFRAAWAEHSADHPQGEPRLEAYLEEASGEERAEALAQLLFVELQWRRARGEFWNKDAYFQRFPQDAPLVKEVYDQAGRLPLLTSQQIFLLAGVCTIPVFLYIIWLIPQASLRFIVWLASRTA